MIENPFQDEVCSYVSANFQIVEAQENAEEIETYQRYKYPTMSKTIGNFKLNVMEGEFTDSKIVVMLGENGTVKTKFIKMLVCLSPLLPHHLPSLISLSTFLSLKSLRVLE